MSSSSCSIPPFTCHQPVDEVAFDLITGIQTHRYRVLKYFSSSPHERVLRSLELEEERLRARFESQRIFWMTWAWPKKIGGGDIDHRTEVPDVEGLYNFVTYGDPGYGEDALFFGADDGGLPVVSKQAKLATGLVWKSFVMNVQLLSYRGAADLPGDHMPTHDLLPTLRRLPVLQTLSRGRAAVLHSSRNIPRISPPLCSAAPVVPALDNVLREWRSILQRQDEEQGSQPREAKPGLGRHPTVRRRPLSYPFDSAAHSGHRELPKFLPN